MYLDMIELEFKDGVIISFGTERNPDESDAVERDRWMQVLQQVDTKLGDCPVPEWCLFCHQK